MLRREQSIPTTFEEAILLVENYILIKKLKITAMVEPYSVIFEEEPTMSGSNKQTINKLGGANQEQKESSWVEKERQ